MRLDLPSRRSRRLLGAACALGSLALLAEGGALPLTASASPGGGAARAGAPARASAAAAVAPRVTGAFSCQASPTATTTTTTTTSTSSTTTLPASTTTVAPTTTTVAPTTSSSTTTTTPVVESGNSSERTSEGKTALVRAMASGPAQAPTTTTAGSSGSATTTTTPVVAAASGYYLLESNGALHNYGGSAFYGSKASDHHLGTTAVSGAATPDGSGYWMLTAEGNVFNFGDAVDYGTPVHSRHSGTFAGIAATPDGEGFWIVTTKGNLFNYGDAAFCGSPVHRQLDGSVVGVVPSPDGNGYWVYTSGGNVFNYGDAKFFGSGHTTSPVVGMAATPDGGGYWLAYANGSVRNFGDAKFFGSAVHIHVAAKVVSFAATPDGGGYWLAYANGSVRNFGDAKFFGSLAHTPPKAPLTIAAIIETIIVPKNEADPFTAGALGYDISDFQCTKTGASTAEAGLPGTTGLAVIQAAGWLDSAANSCLASEASWATAASSSGDPYDLYLFMNSPGTNSAAAAEEGTGPAGTCAQQATAIQPSCQAYNYGYNGAANALAYASSQSVHASLWWLDIENDDLTSNDHSNFSGGQYWSDNTALNDQVIQGAMDALRKGGVTVGIYSTSVQYPKIAGSFVPKGPQVPLWVAGVPWTNPPYTEGGLPSPSTLAAWCAGTANYTGQKGGDLFAGGTPWLLQETPGNVPSPDGLDPDYAC